VVVVVVVVVVVFRPGVPFENTNDKPAALRVVAVVLIVVNIVAVLFIYLLLRRRVSLLRREDKQYIQQSEVCRSVGSSFLLFYAHFSIQKPSHQTREISPLSISSPLLSSLFLTFSLFFSPQKRLTSAFFFSFSSCV